MLSSNLLKRKGVKFVEAKFQDLSGRLKSRTFPVERYDVIKNGFGFDGSSCGFVGIEDSDMIAKPIESTCGILVCDGYKTSFFLCDVEKNGKPFHGFGRNILKTLLEKIPYKVFIGPEVEFYLTRDYLPVDEMGYMDSAPLDKGEKFKKDFMALLEKLNSNFNIQVGHHEVGPSQHEFELKYDEPIEMIDKLISYKYFLRNFAKEKGYDITFMPKPFEGKAGNGMHFHISLWEDGKPLFFKNKDEISDVAKHFIAGILRNVPEIALATNGTVNSYKRLVLGYEAPVYVLWGYSNRSALIRIPRYRDFEPKTIRIEFRALDGLNDHYLACAALIKAGLIGVEKGLELDLPYQKNAYELTEEELERLKVKILPRNLKMAIEEAKNGKILKELLGESFNRFIKIKEKEWEGYCEYLNSKNLPEDTKKITEWEKNNYFLM